MTARSSIPPARDINICDSKLGKSVVQISARTNLAALAWLSPRAFVLLGHGRRAL